MDSNDELGLGSTRNYGFGVLEAPWIDQNLIRFFFKLLPNIFFPYMMMIFSKWSNYGTLKNLEIWKTKWQKKILVGLISGTEKNQFLGTRSITKWAECWFSLYMEGCVESFPVSHSRLPYSFKFATTSEWFFGTKSIARHSQNNC